MGIPERKNREKQALRERILDAARRIVMREGFSALSMRKIADAIEYSPATLYLHFESRDEIARALCTEGYAQLLNTLEPLLPIADPAERLKAIWRAYVTFGVTHPETYRLIFMEDPTYIGAAFASAAQAGEDTGDAAFRLVADAVEALKAQGQVPASVDSEVWTEALWATMHGIVALRLTCPVFPRAPLDTVVDAALDAWFGQQGQVAAAGGPKKPRKRTAAQAAAPKPKPVRT
ncbi:MAG TPA: TetR/AcrR family transcriptional regulator [Paraburkholderia sp.]